MIGTFIRRPVLASVLSILVVLLGLLSLQRLPMALYPPVAPPEVNVTIEYTGANAATVTKAAIVPLERAINGVPGMKYMSSDAGNDGVGVVQVLFETGTDPDVAAINVQNRVNAVMGELPPEVTRNGVKIAKEENAMLLYLNIFSRDDGLDERFLYNFADINVLSELKRIPGVGFADILGAKEYAIRVWLRPDRLDALGVGVDEVLDALEANNVEAAPGKIGENSDRGDSPLQYTLTWGGKYQTPEAYGRIPIRAGSDGSIVRVSDVADVELGTTYFDVEARFNGRPAASIMMKQLPGSNASEVIAAVKARMEVIKDETFLPGMDYAFSFDVSRFLDAALAEVRGTLIEAFILVALVVFVFLRDPRSTMVAIVAVPVSLIGTFAALSMLGFSLNLVTLFAIVLAIGIVVDNAIVVVEAVHVHLEVRGRASLALAHEQEARGIAAGRAATEAAMKEIGGAIVGITLVMGAVFLPLAFISGPAGVFYRQFALTIAVAIGLSGLVALTFTPALCALFLHRHGDAGGRFFEWFDRGWRTFESAYMRAIRLVAPKPFVTVAILVAMSAAAVLVAREVPSGFVPAEDQGTFYISVTTPPGATLERTRRVVDTVAAIAGRVDGVQSVASLAGTNILSDGTGATYGTCLVNLIPWEQRTRSVRDVIDDLRRLTRDITDAELDFFPPPSVPGYGNASGFELRVLDKTGRGDDAEMEAVLEGFVAALRARPEIASAFSIFNAGFPQFRIEIDMDKAAGLGVQNDDVLGALQTLLGSEYATNFIRFGQMYKVMVQAAPTARRTPEDVLAFRITNDAGDSIPLSSFVTLHKSRGVDQMTRLNMYPSAEMNGEGAPGVSSGTVLAIVQDVAREHLPRGFGFDWAGMSRDEANGGNEGVVVFFVCLIFVYLVLSAQYESFLLPIVVVLSLPPGMLGAFGLLKLAGLENNIFTHLALVMLIGLLGKNAILIVEFAEQRLAEGSDPMAAVLDACRQRLRPITMTSLAFVAGLVPLALASGAGAAANQTIGVAAVGGMVAGTLGGLVLVPGLYLLIRRPIRLAISAPPPADDGPDDGDAVTPTSLDREGGR